MVKCYIASYRNRNLDETPEITTCLSGGEIRIQSLSLDGVGQYSPKKRAKTNWKFNGCAENMFGTLLFSSFALRVCVYVCVDYFGSHSHLFSWALTHRVWLFLSKIKIWRKKIESDHKTNTGIEIEMLKNVKWKHHLTKGNSLAENPDFVFSCMKCKSKYFTCEKNNVNLPDGHSTYSKIAILNICTYQKFISIFM